MDQMRCQVRRCPVLFETGPWVVKPGDNGELLGERTLPPMTRWNNNRDEIGAVSADITAETNALPARYFTDPEVHEMEKEK